MANALDRAIGWLSPQAAIKRLHARQVLAYYEAGKPSRLHKNRRETGSGNDAILRAGANMWQQARHFEQNYDIAKGVLDVLVNNTVGPFGIGVEPQPRRSDGTIHDEFAKELLHFWADWCTRPEVTWQHNWASASRVIARTWFRDGEALAQIVEGTAVGINHGTKVPLSLEMMEPDYLPMHLQREAGIEAAIQQGIEVNGWGRPLAYHVYKSSPIETGPSAGLGSFAGLSGQTKRIPAERMLHLATRHRMRQLRGVSSFATVLNRFDDLKDYEESERIAAKVAASMSAYIKKGTPDEYENNPDGSAREMKFRPGMIFDDLRPGEEIGMIDTNRPNPNLETYRSGQLKAVSAGTGASASSISKTYDSNYSARRQELVEAGMTYQTLSNDFVGKISRPVYERVIAIGILSGAIRVPRDVDRETADDAIYITPQMPWIDPKNEALAFAEMEDRHYISGPEIIRKRGGNPMDIIEQSARWQREKERAGLVGAKSAEGGEEDMGGDDEDGNAPPNPPNPAAPPKSPASPAKARERRAHANPSPTASEALGNGIAALAAGISALAVREAPATVVHNHLPAPAATEVHNHLPAPAAPEVHAHFEATIEQPAAPVVNVTVPAQPAPTVLVKNEHTVNVPAADVTVHLPPRQTVSTITRNPAGDMTGHTAIETDV
jgi:lambda family phage portal protein